MALPTIVFNATGSDTAASGSGPATALSGTAASTAASTTVTLLTDNPDLSGVATDGSAALWVGSSSGRRWSKITGVNNTAGVKTVAVQSAYANTESGKSWGIGGKRLSLDGSTQLGLDWIGGWTIDVQSDQTIAANFRCAPTSVSGVSSAFTSTTTVRPIIATATNGIYGLDLQGANNLVISHLSFKSTAGTPGDGIGLAAVTAANYVTVSDCVIDGFRSGIIDRDNGSNIDVRALVISSCEVKNCTVNGITLWEGAQVSDCYVHGNTGRGMLVSNILVRAVSLSNCTFDSNGTMGCEVQIASQCGATIRNCNFSNSTVNAGLYLNVNNGNVVIFDSIFWHNTTYGIQSGSLANGVVIRNCAFGSNSTADSQQVGTGTGPIALAVSPFVSSSDFTLNSTAGGGAACKGAGVAPLGAATATAPDVGAVQTGGAASSGMLFVPNGEGT